MPVRRDKLVTALMLASMVCVPAALGAYLLSKPASPPPPLLAQVATDPGAAATGEQAAAPNPLVLGILHTKGETVVNWVGRRISVKDTRYTYLGGESIQTGPESTAVLQLPGAGTVFLGPNTKASVERRGGQFVVNIVSGQSRFLFNKETPFLVRVNEITLSPAGPSPQGTALPDAPDTFVAEIASHDKGGGLIVALRGVLRATAGEAGDATPVQELGTVDAGFIADIQKRPPAAEEGGAGWDITSLPIPDDIFSTLLVGLPEEMDPGKVGYLFRGPELAEYARIAALPPSAAGPVPEAPPMEPPVPPPLVVAPPDGPPAFDPTVLPPPAAGPEAGAAASIVVAPPAAPVGGTGGGLVASPS